MTEILKFCDRGGYSEGGLAANASLPPPLRAPHLLGSERFGEFVVEKSIGWIGTPFRHQGRVKGVGCDCLGLLIGVAAELALPQAALDEPVYGHYPDGDYLYKRLGEALLPFSEPAPGRIGLFTIDGVARHLGIFGYRDGLTLIHAYAPARRVVEHGYSREWQSRLAGIFALC